MALCVELALVEAVDLS